MHIDEWPWSAKVDAIDKSDWNSRWAGTQTASIRRQNEDKAMLQE